MQNDAGAKRRVPTPEEKLAILHAVQAEAFRLLEANAPLADILAHLARAAEAVADSRVVASILLLDQDGLLRNGASPGLPPDYLKAIDGLKPDMNIGTCAVAAATGEVVLTPDFHDDTKWAELRHLPVALGFRGAWSMPIKSAAGHVMGTFGTYFRERRTPTGPEREAVGLLASIAALAIGGLAPSA